MADRDKDPGLLTLPYMVRWFSPTLLANAAIRAAVSPVFGTYADARSAQANVDGFGDAELRAVAQRYNFSGNQLVDGQGVVWVDYLADTGDGFDSSYAMASLVAQPSLTLSRRGSAEKHELPAGRLLILGGDQVYPYPSREEYASRFERPYRMAFADLTLPRVTFVIPGNHDWYDGLNSFDFLFCQARYGTASGGRIGSLELQQHRSYFAIRLPHKWWIWGADIQFSNYLDAGQVRYFQTVAEMMRNAPEGDEHKVILCVAAPGWQYEESEAAAANSNIRMVADIVEQAGAKICVVLSGDAHHYSRYHSKDLGLNLITAGGGGSFLHPTHQLYDDIDYHWQRAPEPFKFDLYCREGVAGAGRRFEQAVYPSKAQSFWLTWGNLLFPFWNYTFATLLGTFYWLMTWMYSQTPVQREDCLILGLKEPRPLVEDILVYNTATCGLKGQALGARIGDLIGVSLQAGIYQFLLGIFGLILLTALIMYADARSRWKKVLMGTLHWMAHIVAMVALYILVNWYGYWEWFGPWTRTLLGPLLGGSVDIARTVAYMLQMIFGGGVVAGFVWGLYLFITCAFFRRHWNDAFSALRNPDYKNFLRLKIEPQRLTIYPIGLWRSPTRLEWQRGRDKNAGRYVPLIPLAPELIDGPVVIDARQVRKRPLPAAADMT